MPEDAQSAEHQVVIIGAGPAGLTAAYMLTKRGHSAVILEADDVVGGISRTVVADGWRFDIGGHRFFTKVRPVDDLWFEILGAEEFLRRPRMSRIFYRNKLYAGGQKGGLARRELRLRVPGMRPRQTVGAVTPGE